jgi:DNA/RNA endonuclease YhcR with UshA esterase domain
MKKVTYTMLLVLIELIFVFTSKSFAQEQINASQAVNFIGQTKTVCGVIASTKYASYSKGQPTFINLDKPYPNQVFTILIWGRDRAKFYNADRIFSVGKRICATGLISSYRGKPEMTIREPSQIKE